MDQANDQLLTHLSVRLVNLNSEQTAGSGVIYAHPSLDHLVYVLTAAHCLFEDQDTFQMPMQKIGLHFYNPKKNSYGSLVHKINYNLVWKDIDNDIAVLALKIADVEKITGKLPTVNIVTDRNNHINFIAKGFPSATDGKEIVSISPTWSQLLPYKEQFQLHLNQDFSDAYSSVYRIDGFSGSGIFLYDHHQIFLYGIFTRFLDAGKIIYCQPLTKFEQLLTSNYLPPFSYTFFGAHGISPSFFSTNKKRAIAELGPRFNDELNFQLPIASYFDAISKNSIFRQKLTKTVDKQLSAAIYSSGGEETKALEKKYHDLNDEIKNWYEEISWEGGNPIVRDLIDTKIQTFQRLAENKRSELYEKRYKIFEEQNRSSKNHIEPFASDISHLGNMLRNLSDFNDGLDNIHISLSNYPVLLVKGNAGSGKSHLLGDILSNRIQKDQPAILLLGQLFITGKTIWENVLDQLGLTCSKEEFLSTLDNIGKQAGIRVLLMVDAINEGAGKALWHDGIASFIHDCRGFPQIGVVLSIRTTYWRTIIPESVKDNPNVTVVDHKGFKGNEYEAVKLFCEFYKIQQPNFPLLNPEYANPLFLHLVCKGIQQTVEKVFPQGFQGVTKVFSFYLQAVHERLIKKRDIYNYAPHLLTNALNSFAKACFEKERGSMLLSETINLFEEKFSSYPNLLGDLIEESVLIRSLPDRYQREEHGLDQEEIVYFAYERFGDFYIAAELIKDIKNKNEALIKCRKDKCLGNLIDDGGWLYSGILEALAVLLPEKFGLEIFEAFKWVFKKGKSNYNYRYESISRWYLNSLMWRQPESIDDKKFVEWAKTDQFYINSEEYFNFLFEMSSIEGHPFNSDRMTTILFRYSMAERDGFFQKFINYFTGVDDSGTALPINRLVDWAWRPEISSMTSATSARLVGQALCWLLGTTNTGLRDQTTKALVNLLQDQIPVLIELFNKFIAVDDMYIAERLCAVAYGCALRAKESSELEALAITVYHRVFSKGCPPKHLFLRDYCRHIIEFALVRGISFSFSCDSFRPPYNTALPEDYPSKDELTVYEQGETENGSKGEAARANKKIIFSVLSWDFGRYTIESAIRNFECIAFTFEKDIERFRNKLPRGSKTTFNTLKKLYSLYSTPSENRLRFRYGTKEQVEEFWNAVDDLWTRVEAKLLLKLSDEQKSFYYDEILPYWNLQIKSKKDRDLDLDKEKIKLWIAKRCFELGYDGKVHGAFDITRDSYDRQDGPKIERIGKKYQWIAYYEVLSILADNYKVRDKYGSNPKSWIYRGPWDITYRDIDPSFLTKRNYEKYDDEDFGLAEGNKEWFSPPRYIHWKNLQDDWADTIADLPNQIDCIQRRDKEGIEWVYLYSSYTWKAPKLIGESGFGEGRKEIWYLFQSFLVPAAKYQKTLDWLSDQEFHGRWLPESYDVSNLLARECYWSPLSKEYQKEHGLWRNLDDSNLKVLLPSTVGIGSLDKDNSGAHFEYHVPNKKIIDNLDLSYARLDGEFQDRKGKVIFSNISPLGCMIRKDALQEFLDKSNLKIIWTQLGEKNSFVSRGLGRDVRKSLSGVITLENNELKGSPLKISDW